MVAWRIYFLFSFSSISIEVAHDVCVFCLYFSFGCHAWMHTFFLPGYSNTISILFCLLFLLKVICVGFSRFFSCFPFSSKFSSSPILFLYKYLSLKVYFKCSVCLCVETSVCKKIFTNIQKSYWHNHIHAEIDKTLR